MYVKQISDARIDSKWFEDQINNKVVDHLKTNSEFPNVALHF